MNQDQSYVPNDCKLIKVFINYKPEPIMMKTWSRALVTRAKYIEALKFIAQAYNQNQNIRFGTIGEELKPYNSDNSNNFIQKILSMFKDKENTFTKQTGSSRVAMTK